MQLSRKSSGRSGNVAAAAWWEKEYKGGKYTLVQRKEYKENKYTLVQKDKTKNYTYLSTALNILDFYFS